MRIKLNNPSSVYSRRALMLWNIPVVLPDFSSQEIRQRNNYLCVFVMNGLGEDTGSRQDGYSPKRPSLKFKYRHFEWKLDAPVIRNQLSVPGQLRKTESMAGLNPRTGGNVHYSFAFQRRAIAHKFNGQIDSHQKYRVLGKKRGF